MILIKFITFKMHTSLQFSKWVGVFYSHWFTGPPTDPSTNKSADMFKVEVEWR